VLVLTRKVGETFIIGDDVSVTVVDIIGANKVRLGITAPAAIRIYREEIYELIRSENRAAAGAEADALVEIDLPDRDQAQS
jgi:carbon storage regulator